MSVSDTLADAVMEIDEQIADGGYGGPGEDPHERIRAVRRVMDEMRGELDDQAGLLQGGLVDALVNHLASKARARVAQ